VLYKTVTLPMTLSYFNHLKSPVFMFSVFLHFPGMADGRDQGNVTHFEVLRLPSYLWNRWS